jgi:hypothetical protein
MPVLGTDFSEAGFAFGFLENLLRSSLLHRAAAPTFITTYAEGAGLHYDVHLNAAPVAFFFQFKIPDVLQKGAGLSSGARLLPPFYRMNLRQENAYAQHHGLRALENAGGNIYYVTPRFHSGADFDPYFSRNIIPNFSAWFRPSVVTPPNFAQPHGVVYDVTGKMWEVRSKGGRTGDGGIDFEAFLKRWTATCREAPVVPMEKFTAELGTKLEAAILVARESTKAEGAKNAYDPALVSMNREEALFDKERHRLLQETRPRETSALGRIALRARSELGLHMIFASVRKTRS